MHLQPSADALKVDGIRIKDKTFAEIMIKRRVSCLHYTEYQEIEPKLFIRPEQLYCFCG